MHKCYFPDTLENSEYWFNHFSYRTIFGVNVKKKI